MPIIIGGVAPYEGETVVVGGRTHVVSGWDEFRKDYVAMGGNPNSLVTPKIMPAWNAGSSSVEGGNITEGGDIAEGGDSNDGCDPGDFYASLVEGGLQILDVRKAIQFGATGGGWIENGSRGGKNGIESGSGRSHVFVSI